MGSVTNITKFILSCTVFFGFLSIFILFHFSQDSAMTICRGISLIGACGLWACSIILLKYFYNYHKHKGFEKDTFEISISIKLFTFVITLFSIGGYYLRIPYIYVIQQYDFALYYANFWLMIIADNFYAISIIIYFILQLFYLWFFLSNNGFFESKKQRYKKYIFAFTLIINFWQKWLCETLIAREEICEELHKNNRYCNGQREYATNFSLMSDVEQEAYHLVKLVGPFSYSCTMEILAVYLTVLFYCQQKNDQPEEMRWSKSYLKLPSSGSLIIHFIKFLMALVLILLILYMTGQIAALFHDENQPRTNEKTFYRWTKFAFVILRFVVYLVLIWVYKNIEATETGDDRETCCFSRFLNHFNISGLCSTTKELDLLILKCMWWLTTAILVIEICLQTADYFYGGFIDTDKLLLTIIPDITSTLALALQFNLIKGFLTCNFQTFKELSQHHFTTHYMVPYQIIRSILRATNCFIISQDPEISLLSHETLEKWINIFNAAYPFSPLINITSALCWAHIMEKFYAVGAYNLFSRHSKNVELKRRNSIV